jgi:lactoylglutathione lyase
MKFAHTTISTARYQESIDFYRDVAGLSVVTPLPNGVVTFLSDSEGDTRIEIIKDNPPTFSGEGISVGFVHDDPVAYRDVLRDKGYEVSDIIRPGGSTVFFFVRDPNGLKVQFIRL